MIPEPRRRLLAAPHHALVARLILTLFAFLALTPALRADDSSAWKLVQENWYLVELADQPAGWMSSFVHEKGDRLRSASTINVSMERGSIPISMEITTSFIETRGGQPILMSVRQVMSQQPVEMNWHFGEDGVKEVALQGGRETTREHPHPEGVWLTPRAAQRYMLERAKAGAEEIEFRTLDASRGIRPTHVRSRRAGDATALHEGREIPVTIWRTTSDAIAPLEMVEHYSADGQLMYQELPMGLGRMIMRRVSREEALGAQGGPVPELFIQTVIAPDRPIKDVMQTKRATFRLRVKDGAMPELPSTGAQRFTMEEGGQSAILIFDVSNFLEAPSNDRASEEHLRASPLIDSDDELVRALARRAVRELPESKRSDISAQAEAMRAFVKRYISNKGLDTAFASASETARTRTGDCSEHAVLLAAMLRAADIPARVASGLVYVEEFIEQKGVFGWHMWTQALIDGRWIELDSTLPVPHHAAYVTTGVSSLADGGGADQGPMMALIGNLEIEVLSVE